MIVYYSLENHGLWLWLETIYYAFTYAWMHGRITRKHVGAFVQYGASKTVNFVIRFCSPMGDFKSSHPLWGDIYFYELEANEESFSFMG